MKVFSTIAEIRRERWADPLSVWGLVPTMGALHDGHLSLVRSACRENERVGVSIFVNPTQFNDSNDLAVYPQNLEHDLELLAGEGVDMVWTPTPEIVYPAGYQTYIEVEDVTCPLEGATRPGHFRGVATVVAKLFNLFQPHRVYFGQKDAQQVTVIKRLVQDLNFNLEIITCPIVREPDGLAMSSRNSNLLPTARQQAGCLYQALLAGKAAFNRGERRAEYLFTVMRAVIEEADMADMDYISVAHPDSLEELEIVESRALLSLAVFIGGVRLIDNMVLGD